ncbi:MAG TPA: RsfS/YbeB/iojap family protein [Candidatus Azoamicus sp.]
MLYLVFNLLSENGMSNVSVFSGEILFLDYIVVSNGTSIKHIKSTSFKILKYFKFNSNISASVSGINSDWVVIDIESILIHLMLLKSRNFYDLDSLYIENSKKLYIS